MFRTGLLLILFCFNTGVTSAPASQVTVPDGWFQFGCSDADDDCESDEGTAGGIRIFVPAFKIDTQETSVSEYRQCVNDGVCERPFDYRRTHYCNYDAPQRDDYPQNCVNWQQAQDYCEWRGARLAYSVEWERAARGDTSTRYFWGNEAANCSRAVMDPGNPGDSDLETDGCWRDLSWPRNSFAANPFGLFDMIGGTSEWVLDWYGGKSHMTYYSNKLKTGPKEGRLKVIRGGSWDEKYRSQRVSNNYAKPIKGNPDLYGSNGIRCVETLDGSLSYP